MELVSWGQEPSSDAITESDTLFMVGTSFPYIEYLPKPGQATGIQIDIKPEKDWIKISNQNWLNRRFQTSFIGSYSVTP